MTSNCFIYLDDILVALESKKKHLKHIKLLFDRLKKFGMVLNTSKFVFAVPKLEFLGQHISSSGSIPVPAMVAAIKDFPSPSKVVKMMRFCSMANFHYRIVPRLSLLMEPLFKTTAGAKKKDKVKWTYLVEKAFQSTKSALCQATNPTNPVHPDATPPSLSPPTPVM